MASTRGPVPKRTAQRRRTNKAETPVVTAPAAPERPVQPAPDEDWHPKATAWYVALGASGQARFYEASDWAQAVVAAEVLSRMLTNSRLSAPLVAAWLSMSTGLLTTEGDRRRMRIELERGGPDVDAEAGEAFVADFTARLRGV